MGIDLFIAGLILLFAIFGALTGAARQIAQLVALFAAYVCARPIGTFFGPRLARALDAPLVVGTIAATMLTFIVVLIAVRYVLTVLLRRLLAGDEREEQGPDRALGFILGAVKAALFIYVVLCAATFVERNVTVAGRRLLTTSRDSLAFGVARKWNLFELTQFHAVKDLAQVASRASANGPPEQLASDPAFQSLRKDPRFRKLLDDPALRRAAAEGDYQGLLKSNAVLQLIQDPEAAAKIEAAAAKLR